MMPFEMNTLFDSKPCLIIQINIIFKTDSETSRSRGSYPSPWFQAPPKPSLKPLLKRTIFPEAKAHTTTVSKSTKTSMPLSKQAVAKFSRRPAVRSLPVSRNMGRKDSSAKFSIGGTSSDVPGPTKTDRCGSSDVPSPRTFR